MPEFPITTQAQLDEVARLVQEAIDNQDARTAIMLRMDASAQGFHLHNRNGSVWIAPHRPLPRGIE